MFTPVKLGNTTLPPEVLKADKKSCKRYGPCGVGEQALYLNSFFIDRRYYVALESVRRVFKRVAMSKGGFTGKGAFGSIPYLVVELDGQSAKQFGSQGQTRTAALSLKLAQREIFQQETGEWPVLLLDDVLSELDGKRQSFVLNRIQGGQVFITCCEPEKLDGLERGKSFQIQGGTILSQRSV